MRHLVGLVAVALVVAGAAVLGVQAWQLLVVSPGTAHVQSDLADRTSGAWAARATTAPTAVSTEPPTSAEPTTTGDTVAVIRVPRFGRGWSRVIRQGIDATTVLDSATAGVGHYVHTAMPGGVGNFAIAGHDTGYGDAFLHVADLRLGDRILVQTADGWYTYAFRNLQWVLATGVQVLEPVPGRPGALPTERLITLTTCDPPYDAKERLIAYGVLADFRPTSAGPPPGWR